MKITGSKSTGFSKQLINVFFADEDQQVTNISKIPQKRFFFGARIEYIPPIRRLQRLFVIFIAVDMEQRHAFHRIFGKRQGKGNR